MPHPIHCYWCNSYTPVIIVKLPEKEHYQVECQICKTRGPINRTAKEAILNWNEIAIQFINGSTDF